MIEYVIRRAIIWAITIAVVAGVSAAVSNATRNAMSKSLESKLAELGIDKDDPDPEIMKDLIDVNVVRRGTYVVSVQENVYGLFATTYTAKNKNDAIEKLGKKVFGFANLNKDVLDKEVTEFYLRIWFETLGKNRITSKIESAKYRKQNIVNEISYKNVAVNAWNRTLLANADSIKKLESKIIAKPKKEEKLTAKIDIINVNNSDLQVNINQTTNEINNLIAEREELSNIISELSLTQDNPEFVISKKAFGLKGMTVNI